MHSFVHSSKDFKEYTNNAFRLFELIFYKSGQIVGTSKVDQVFSEEEIGLNKTREDVPIYAADGVTVIGTAGYCVTLGARN